MDHAGAAMEGGSVATDPLYHCEEQHTTAATCANHLPMCHAHLVQPRAIRLEKYAGTIDNWPSRTGDFVFFRASGRFSPKE
jgi:hypothetical protein